MSPQQFRILGFAEAISLLTLLFVAMPLKYLAGFPVAVRVVGLIHGILFLFYVATAVLLAIDERWRPRKLALAIVAATLPLGPFVFDRKLVNLER